MSILPIVHFEFGNILAVKIPAFWSADITRYLIGTSFMALVRILVDGYSLLHNWPELAPGQPRHSARAREELVHVLTRYHDATGKPVTVFFDGAGRAAERAEA